VQLTVLSDFDGTIVDIDTAEYVLDKFAHGKWRVYDSQFARGEITLEECIQRQFSLVRTSKKTVLRQIENAVNFRPNFESLVEYCTAHALRLIVVSAGLDFLIEHFLRLKNCLELLKIYTAKSKFTSNGIVLDFPKLRYKDSLSFKDDLVRQFKRQGKQVVYIGDGTGDAEAIRIADFRFAIKDSRLAEMCREEHIACTEIEDFDEVVEAIRSIGRS
jgi:2-hydroxy-3-keto-5-methylthiopentenyl-1-phosphate phosphatase